MHPEISIIIPTKNEEKCIEKAIRQYSKIKKKFKIEVIVSDGGSTDSTVEIAKKYADKIVIAKTGEKQTIAIGRNAGAKVARGKILFHTDADVIIPRKEEFFKKINGILKNKGIVGATTKLKVSPAEKDLRDTITHFIINSSVRIVNQFGSFLGRGECQIVKTSAFRSIGGYNEKIVVGEDGNLFYRLRKKGKIAYMSDLFVYHSPRRFRNLGYIKVLLMYLREGIYLLLFRRSYVKEWKPER